MYAIQKLVTSALLRKILRTHRERLDQEHYFWAWRCRPGRPGRRCASRPVSRPSWDEMDNESAAREETLGAAPGWVVAAYGLFAGIIVWSPSTGSAVQMAVIAGLCVVAMSLLAPQTKALSGIKGSVVPLALVTVGFVGLFALSVWAVVEGSPWASWCAAVLAGVAVSVALLLSDRRSRRLELPVEAAPL